MGRTITFDLDDVLAKAKIFADEAPSMLQMAGEAGWGGAAKLSPYLPMAGPLASLISKLAGGKDGLSSPSLPDTGPRGRGRLKYLRDKSRYDDSSVVKACELVTTANLPMSRTVAETVNYTLRCMYPDTPRDSWSDAQTRTGIDRILDEDGLSEDTCDRLGDLIYYALCNPPKTAAALPSAPQQE